MTDQTNAFYDLDQHTLAQQARDAYRFARAIDRARLESEAARDLAALNNHLQDLAIRPVHHPMIDADGVVTALIYRPEHPQQPPRPGERKGTQIWTCAQLGRIWLRRADGDHDAIDDERHFTDLADLGRVILEAPAPTRQENAVTRATEMLTQATGLRGRRGLRQAVIGLGWAVLAHAAQHR